MLVGILVALGWVTMFSQAAKSRSIVYSVTGSGSAEISTNFDDFHDQELPWSRKESDSGFAEDRSLEAHSNLGATITCTIRIDGRIEDRSTGRRDCFCDVSL